MTFPRVLPALTPLVAVAFTMPFFGAFTDAADSLARIANEGLHTFIHIDGPAIHTLARAVLLLALAPILYMVYLLITSLPGLPTMFAVVSTFGAILYFFNHYEPTRGPLPRPTSTSALTPLHTTIHGKAFRDSTVLHNPNGQGQITFRFESHDIETVNVQILINRSQFYCSPDLRERETITKVFPLAPFAGRIVKHCRYRPGLLGINGTDGGDMFWTCPMTGDVEVTLRLQVS